MEQGRIPNSLKKYRRLHGLSQTDVAKVLGLKDSSCICRWEQGICLPGTEQLFRLSLLYKTPPNNLYFDFWQVLKKDVQAVEQKLLAQAEPIINDELFFL
jgi:transcriptional regulator with XRE-family HTH domain